MDKWLKEQYKADKVSDTSADAYIRILKIVGAVRKLINLDFLEDIDKVKANIIKMKKSDKPVSENTLKNRLTAILATVRFLDIPESIKTKYKEMHDEVGKKLRTIDESGVKNDKQKAYYMSKTEIEEKTAELKKKAEDKSGRFLDNQNYLIWCLYTKVTPRRNLDYWLMDIVEDDTDWKTLPKERNYLMMKQKLLIFNQHKNTRYTEQKEIVEKIDLSNNEEMMEIIKDYLQYIPTPKDDKKRKVLLCYQNGIRWQRAAEITKRLTTLSGKEKFGTNALRHIIAEHNAPPREELDKLKKAAVESGHDILTHMTTYIKKTTL
jgi:hypothetical protein